MSDELIALLKEIRPSYGDVGSRDVDVAARQKQIDRAIELLEARAGETVEVWQVRYMGDPRQPGYWERSSNPAYAKEAYENCPNHTDGNGWQYRPLYTRPTGDAAGKDSVDAGENYAD